MVVSGFDLIFRLCAVRGHMYLSGVIDSSLIVLHDFPTFLLYDHLIVVLAHPLLILWITYANCSFSQPFFRDIRHPQYCIDSISINTWSNGYWLCVMFESLEIRIHHKLDEHR